MNENIIATEGNSTWDSSNKVKVQAKLTNAGSIAAQIINLWVFDTSRQTYGFYNMSGSNLNPGQVLDLTGSNAKIVTVNASNGDNFNAWFVTARGNTVPVTESAGIIIAQVSQGIGSVAMNFSSFKYYNVGSSPYRLINYPAGWAEGYSVPASSEVAFEVTLTNYDHPNKRDINLTSGSILWTIFPVTGTQPRAAGWYIVNIYDNGNIKPTFSTVTLKFGVPTKIIFASKRDISQGFQPSSAQDWWNGNQGPSAANLLLVGKIGTSTFGQNIPFVAIYFT
jgi:hypothetical protein